jgi:choline kinase
MKAVKKVVFPVAGLGTRMLPATKVLPKEMLPVVDKPIIQYALEEAAAAGCEEFIFVTGRGKTIIEDHFDRAVELFEALAAKGKEEQLAAMEAEVPRAGRVVYTRQQEAKGLGHAVWCARRFIADEVFAVVLVDDLIHSEKPCLQQMIEAQAETGGNMVAVMEVAKEHTARYGIVEPGHEDRPAGRGQEPGREARPGGRPVALRGDRPLSARFRHLRASRPPRGGCGWRDPAHRRDAAADRQPALPRLSVRRRAPRLRRQARLSRGDRRHRPCPARPRRRLQGPARSAGSPDPHKIASAPTPAGPTEIPKCESP